VTWIDASMDWDKVDDIDDEVEATDAGRGGTYAFVNVGRGFSARGAAFGVTLPGDVERDVRRVFMGDALRIVESPPKDCRGRPTGVTNPFDAPLPLIVLARGCVDTVVCGCFATETFSALGSGINIPEVGLEVEKYRTPPTLPSFFP
jgi:hypothetical protein